MFSTKTKHILYQNRGFWGVESEFKVKFNIRAFCSACQLLAAILKGSTLAQKGIKSAKTNLPLKIIRF